MSQLRGRNRGNQTVDYKEQLAEALAEMEEMQGRLDEIANIAAPEVDHDRIERIEAGQMLCNAALLVLLKDRFGPAGEPAPDASGIIAAIESQAQNEDASE